MLSSGGLRFGAWWVLPALLACGGESGDAQSCGAFDACGGDATGTWVSESLCENGALDEVVNESASQLPPACAGAFTASLRPETTLNVDAAGAFVDQGTWVIDFRMSFNLPCISAAAGQPVPAAAIPTFCQAFQDEFGTTPDAPFQGLACTALQSSCDCTAFQNVAVDQRGILDPELGIATLLDGSTAEFCVNGDELTLRADGDSLGPLLLTYTR